MNEQSAKTDAVSAFQAARTELEKRREHLTKQRIAIDEELEQIAKHLGTPKRTRKPRAKMPETKPAPVKP